ncbi:MAG: putative surface protein bspA-like [Candidatus Malacoplasma girerdii]|nr:MAG: putative surface protein bspA-like [Candidatus Malacoplasma girerdii]
MKKIVMPDSVTSIGLVAFDSCPTTEIELSNNLQGIGTDAFEFCHYLQKINIPHTVNKIGGSAFSTMKSLTDIYFNWSKDEIKNVSLTNECFIGFYSETTINFHVPTKDDLNVYKQYLNEHISDDTKVNWVFDNEPTPTPTNNPISISWPMLICSIITGLWIIDVISSSIRIGYFNRKERRNR